jgi:hypothetical protein
MSSKDDINVFKNNTNNIQGNKVVPYYEEDADEHYHTTPVSKNNSDVAISSSDSFESPPDVSPIKSLESESELSESSPSEESENRV